MTADKEQFLKTLAQLTVEEVAQLYGEARKTYERKTIFDSDKEQEVNEIHEAFKKFKR